MIITIVLIYSTLVLLNFELFLLIYKLIYSQFIRIINYNLYNKSNKFNGNVAF